MQQEEVTAEKQAKRAGAFVAPAENADPSVEEKRRKREKAAEGEENGEDDSATRKKKKRRTEETA
jgi:ribosomal RNA assembly protein